MKLPAQPQVPPTAPAIPARIPVALLMQGQTEILLVHQGRDYRLRITQTGKLILTT